MTESRALEAHRRLRGKVRMVSAAPLDGPEDLALLYTPGVAEACLAVRDDPAQVWELTGRGNMVAVVSDGSAVLGLGNIGPLAGLPVMEGKALLFHRFARIDAVPLVLDTQDVDRICDIVRALAPSFGGINLEDIASPRCFEVERRLQEELDIPVFHDDQHGTAVVVLAALFNVCRYFGRGPSEVRIVLNGAGAAGTAITRLLLEAGFERITVCDRFGILGDDFAHRPDHFGELARITQPCPTRGTLAEALKGAHVFIGVSAPGVLTPSMVGAMAPECAVFALANPVPEITPEEVSRTRAVLCAFGKSGVHNQINNVLAFPGIFRGALDVRSRRIVSRMKIAAARALAGLVTDQGLQNRKVVPDPFDARVVPAVALAVAGAAVEAGQARRPLASDAYARELEHRLSRFEFSDESN